MSDGHREVDTIKECKSEILNPPAGSAGLGASCLLERKECLQALCVLAERADAIHQPYAVLWLNIDRFKWINDSFGHKEGDKVLAMLRQRVEQVCLGQGHIARMGSDEFVVMLAGCDAGSAGHMAHAILEAISQPLMVADLRIRPSVSIGVATSDRYRDPVEMLERADHVMHVAKRLGGAQFLFAHEMPQNDAPSTRAARDDLAIEELLHRALESDALHLEYQPIIRVADGALESVEALMRCQIDGISLSPGRFIPVAERTGLILRLGDWGLMTATALAARMSKAGRRVKVSVNVSRAQLIAPKFTQGLNAAILLSDAATELIELEITESLFMDQSEVVRNNLNAVLDAGFYVAIDDFGTGYSCLASLKDLPAHKLKLDRAFVIDLPHDKRSFAVAKAVSHMAIDLGMAVVAEGVETAEQYETLCEAGVTAIQGFYLARPMPEQALDDWLTARGSV